MLVGDDADRADLRTLIEAVVASHQREEQPRLVLAGPAIIVGPKTAANLAMAIHELATNAAKYGALSGEKGTVTVNWTFDGPRLRLVWQERGGPPVEPASQRGFGSVLLTKALFPAPNASRLTFDADGVRYELFIADDIAV